MKLKIGAKSVRNHYINVKLNAIILIKKLIGLPIPFLKNYISFITISISKYNLTVKLVNQYAMGHHPIHLHITLCFINLSIVYFFFFQILKFPKKYSNIHCQQFFDYIS